MEWFNWRHWGRPLVKHCSLTLNLEHAFRVLSFHPRVLIRTYVTSTLTFRQHSWTAWRPSSVAAFDLPHYELCTFINDFLPPYAICKKGFLLQFLVITRRPSFFLHLPIESLLLSLSHVVHIQCVYSQELLSHSLCVSIMLFKGWARLQSGEGGGMQMMGVEKEWFRRSVGFFPGYDLQHNEWVCKQTCLLQEKSLKTSNSLAKKITGH